jgi:hypothetical protein
VIGSGVHRAMSTLDSPAIASLLAQLFAQADRGDPAAFERADAALKRLGHPPDQRQRAELMRDVYMPISPDVGRLLYVLARSRGAKLIVEFGTSFGISGIRSRSGGAGCRQRRPPRRHRARPDQGRTGRA